MSTKICIKDSGSDNAELFFLVGDEHVSITSLDFQDDVFATSEKLHDLISDYIKREKLSEFMGVSITNNGRTFCLTAGDTAGVPTEKVFVSDVGDLCDPFDAAEVLLRVFNILDK